MATQIPVRLISLLQQVLQERCVSMQNVLAQDGTLRLTNDQAFDLRQALTDELCVTGLNDNDEPDARGHDLERLIDLAGHAAKGDT